VAHGRAQEDDRIDLGNVDTFVEEVDCKEDIDSRAMNSACAMLSSGVDEEIAGRERDVRTARKPRLTENLINDAGRAADVRGPGEKHRARLHAARPPFDRGCEGSNAALKKAFGRHACTRHHA
jgi:hypothetical protein